MRRVLSVPVLVLAAAWLCFAACVLLTADRLPDRVATHFGSGGLADGWMSRTGHVCFSLGGSAAVVMFMAALGMLIRRLRGAGLNVPNKEYWLAPDRHQATFDYIQGWALWFAVLLVGFFAGMHHAILAANLHSPAVLRSAEIGWLSGGFTLATLLWVSVLIAHFFRRPR